MDEGDLGGIDVGRTDQAMTSDNALVFNALVFNALVFNSMEYDDLGDVSDMTSTQQNTLKSSEQARQFLTYAWECAMRPSDRLHITWGTSTTSDDVGPVYGSYGLAPEWGIKSSSDGSKKCGLSCQRWVSACLSARVNNLGQKVSFSAVKSPYYGSSSADHLEYRNSTESKVYGTLEGAYFGNFFGSEPKIYGCANEHSGIFTLADIESRFCGSSTSGCDITKLHADCMMHSGSSFTEPGHGTCTTQNSNGAFHGCYTDGIREEFYYDGGIKKRWTYNGTRYNEVITVFRADTCDHVDWEVGTKLPRSCSACANRVGYYDSYCATNSWDKTCVTEAKSWCVDHSTSSTGSPLSPQDNSCTGIVCSNDPYCCSTWWDSACTAAAAEMCG